VQLNIKPKVEGAIANEEYRTLEAKTSKPGWRDLINRAKHDFPKDEDVEERRERLSLASANGVDVYMGLDTRWKNVTTRKGERFFTLILDAIFKRILEKN